MGFAKKYVTYPNPQDPINLATHIRETHNLFVDAGFIQTGDIRQLDTTSQSVSFDYSIFTDTTSYGTVNEIGRLWYDFPDFYDNDGNDFKLKIGIVFNIIKNTAYSNGDIKQVSLDIRHYVIITDSTNGEGLPLNSGHSAFSTGGYLYSGQNTVSFKSASYSLFSYDSVVSYNKETKSLYVNICPNHSYGYSTRTRGISCIMLIGAYARDTKDQLYNGVNNTFICHWNYQATNEGDYSIPNQIWYRIHKGGRSGQSINNQPMSLVSSTLSNGNYYYQNLYTQTAGNSYISPCKSILIAHKDFSVPHNTILYAEDDDGIVGRFIGVDTYTYNKSIVYGDSSGTLTLLVRIDDE